MSAFRAIDVAVHNWAFRLGMDPEDVVWRIVGPKPGAEDQRVAFEIDLEGSDERVLQTFRQPLEEYTQVHVMNALAAFRKKISPGAPDLE